MDIVDLLFVVSYFVIACCFVLFIMSEEIRRLLSKLKDRFYHEVLGKETLEQDTVLEHPYKRESTEERREEALDYLVEKYFEAKKREEQYMKKLESYGKVRRWAYRRSMNLKDVYMFFTESIVKPSIIFAMTYSTALSMYLGIRTGPQIVKFTKRYVPLPFNYVLDILIIFPIGFSPSILGIVLNYHVEKKKLKRMLKNYGIEI